MIYLLCLCCKQQPKPAQQPQRPSAAAGAGAAAAGGAAAQRGSTRFDEEGKPKKYNSAPPPTLQYTTDVALALAANAVEDTSGKGPSAAVVIQPASPTRAEKAKAVFSKPINLTEEDKKRSEVSTRG